MKALLVLVLPSLLRWKLELVEEVGKTEEATQVNLLAQFQTNRVHK